MLAGAVGLLALGSLAILATAMRFPYECELLEGPAQRRCLDHPAWLVTTVVVGLAIAVALVGLFLLAWSASGAFRIGALVMGLGLLATWCFELATPPSGAPDEAFDDAFALAGVVVWVGACVLVAMHPLLPRRRGWLIAIGLALPVVALALLGNSTEV